MNKKQKLKVTRWVNKCIKNQDEFLKEFGYSREEIIESDNLLDDIVWNYAADELGIKSLWDANDDSAQFMNDEIGRLWHAIEMEYQDGLMVRFKLRADVFDPDLNWKKDTTYCAKQIIHNGQKCIEAYFPGSPIHTIFPLSYVEIIKK